MSLPRVAIIGRPNVGKSSLLNLLAGRKVSIVDATAGVTRDRVATLAKLPPLGDDEDPIAIEIVDTGGYGIDDVQGLTADVERQIARALGEADLVLFVIDAQDGILPLDERAAELVRKGGGEPVGGGEATRPRPLQRPGGSGDESTSRGPKEGPRHAKEGTRPVLLVANKVDAEHMESQAYEAMSLGFGEPIMVSATTAHGAHDLREAIRDALPADVMRNRSPMPEPGPLIAIVGKRNAGKSTLTNALAGDDRVIVSGEAGTTRDSVDVRFEVELADGTTQPFTAIDTAGVRKRKSLADDLEYYALHRALRSVRRADVCLLMIDAAVEVSSVDRKLAEEILRHHRPTVIVVNKWDLAEKKSTREEYVEYLDKALRGLSFAPIVFITAKESDGLRELLGMALNLAEQASHRVPTAKLNEAVERVMAERGPAAKGGRQAKIYFATQVGTNPPTIVLSVNDPQLFDANYQAFLLNRLRDELPFSEVPIELLVRQRQRRGQEERSEIAKREG